jgi:hypothetical protein
MGLIVIDEWGVGPLSSAVIEIGGILIRAESERKKWDLFAFLRVLSVC